MTDRPEREIGKLFQIGTKPLDLADWIAPDAELAAYLDEKERLLIAHPAEVFAAEPGTEAAQAELLTLLSDHLVSRYPEIYRRRGEVVDIVPAGRSVALHAAELPLMTAARLVQEDLVLMRRGDVGWRLAAASLSFPSSWRLRDKFGRPLHEVHGPVPGFGDGTRNAMLIARMFDHLRPETPMIRWNWSLYGDAELFHPEPTPVRHFTGGAVLRLERQTLRLLPVSGDIVFTIRIYLDPLDAVAAMADGRTIAATLCEQLIALSEEQLGYKGMTAECDAVVARLRGMASR